MFIYLGWANHEYGQREKDDKAFLSQDGGCKRAPPSRPVG
jgi:hypothetical protein